jgi:hypothetical protein
VNLYTTRAMKKTSVWFAGLCVFAELWLGSAPEIEATRVLAITRRIFHMFTPA